jgi:hypothetical protein
VEFDRLNDKPGTGSDQKKQRVPEHSVVNM